jgi:hypothetical protein
MIMIMMDYDYDGNLKSEKSWTMDYDHDQMVLQCTICTNDSTACSM